MPSNAQGCRLPSARGPCPRADAPSAVPTRTLENIVIGVAYAERFGAHNYRRSLLRECRSF
jgi:hypothetical protein